MNALQRGQVIERITRQRAHRVAPAVSSST